MLSSQVADSDCRFFLCQVTDVESVAVSGDHTNFPACTLVLLTPRKARTENASHVEL